MSDSKDEKLFENILEENNSKLPTIHLAIPPEGGQDLDSDIDTKKQIRYGTRWQAAWGIFSEYCDNSTIHGIKYLGEQKRPILERVFWICVFVLSISSCITVTLNIWNEWNNNPTIVSYAEKSTPVWEIPFPAVTICKERKYDVKTFDYGKIIDPSYNRTQDEIKYLEAVSQICYRDDLKEIDLKKQFKVVNVSNIIKAIDQVLDLKNPCWKIKWQNKEQSCSIYFKRVITEEGICYTFNNIQPEDIYREEALEADAAMNDYDVEDDDDDYEHVRENYSQTNKTNASENDGDDFHVNDGDDDDDDSYYENYDYNQALTFNESTQWNIENGYNLDANKNAFPFRVLRDGAKAGLFLEVEDDYEDNARCEGRVPGFKVLLHTPGEIPKVSEQFISIPFNQLMQISIKPEIITTSEGLRHYDPMRRHCYFQHERHLRYFKVYAQRNCELECLSNFTMEHCGCVKFSMPRTKNTPVCGGAKLECMLEAEDFLTNKEFMESPKKAEEGYSVAKGCNCLPGCSSISYNAEISQGSIDLLFAYSHWRKKNVRSSRKLYWSEISIFFKEAQILTSKRSELYTLSDYLASCGGLFGLFMGISTLSITELVYFCFIKPISKLRIRRRECLELERVQSNEV